MPESFRLGFYLTIFSFPFSPISLMPSDSLLSSSNMSSRLCGLFSLNYGTFLSCFPNYLLFLVSLSLIFSLFMFLDSGLFVSLFTIDCCPFYFSIFEIFCCWLYICPTEKNLPSKSYVYFFRSFSNLAFFTPLSYLSFWRSSTIFFISLYYFSD